MPWITLIICHAAAGLLMGLLFLAYRSPTFAKFKIAADPQRNMEESRAQKVALLNASLSAPLIFAVCYLFQGTLFYASEAPAWLMVVEGVAAFMIYDFAYYFIHRYPFHEWKLMRAQHAVHHGARHPTAFDAIMLHPYETVAGLLLFFASIAAVGGVHLYTFAVMLFIYMMLNVLNHAGLVIPYGPLRLIGVISVKHDRHHHSMLSGNYASITPLPDMVFGTVE